MGSGAGGDDLQVRISDADRGRAAERLQAAFGEGRITMTELDERMAQVYAARFAGDLTAPLGDLPGAPILPMLATPPAQRPGATLVARTGTVAEPLLLKTGSGSVKRQGPWVLPPALANEVASGSVLLDCTEAVVEYSPVTIGVTVRSGTVKILLPDGATADINRVQTRTGTAKSQVGGVPTPEQLHVVISGTVGSGTVVVRRPRRGIFGR